VDGWAAKQPDQPSRSEAIRRLAELGLKQPSPARAHRAKELAKTTIEVIIDPSTSAEERAARSRQLTKGPAEYRGARVDLPKPLEDMTAKRKGNSTAGWFLRVAAVSPTQLLTFPVLLPPGD
jgi:hypothetical protein